MATPKDSIVAKFDALRPQWLADREARQFDTDGFGEFTGERYAACGMTEDGLLTRAEAEALSEAKGWPPFESYPDPASIDVLAMPDWTLPMAVTWIIHREPSAVAKVTEAYRSQSRVWRVLPKVTIVRIKEPRAIFTKGGTHLHVLDRKIPATWFGLLYEVEDRQSLGFARADLLRQFAEGGLGCSAITEQGGRVSISSASWQDFSVKTIRGVDIIETPGQSSLRAPTVRRDEVLRIWPAMPDKPAAEIEETAAPVEVDAGAKKGSEADARREWDQEMAEVRGGTMRQRSQKLIEADYPARFHVSREMVRGWIKGTRSRGRPTASGTD